MCREGPNTEVVNHCCCRLGLMRYDIFGLMRCDVFGLMRCDVFGLMRCDVFGLTWCDAFGLMRCDVFCLTQCQDGDCTRLSSLLSWCLRMSDTLWCVFQSLMQRQDEDRAKMEQASELVSEVEHYKQMEVELKDQLTKVGPQRSACWDRVHSFSFCLLV